MQQNSDKTYNGPVSHSAILRKIMDEAIEQKREVSPALIESTVSLFFSGKVGIRSYIRDHKPVWIKGLGRFTPSKKLLKKIEESKKVKKRKETVQRRRSKRNYVYRIRLLDRARMHLNLFDDQNEKFKKKGWKQWTWRDYCSINHITTCIKLYKKIRAEKEAEINRLNNHDFKQGDIVLTPNGKIMMVYTSFTKRSIISGQRVRSCYVCRLNRFMKPDMRSWGNGERMPVFPANELMVYKK